MEIEIPQLQSYLFLLFLTFSLSFLSFSLVLLLLRLRPWCNCSRCKTYLTSSWRTEFTNLSDWYTHLLKESPTGTVHIHVLGNTITSNPANVEHMLKTRFENYPKGKQFFSILGDLLGQGIFNSDGDKWRFQRKMASLELGSISVRSYAFKIIGAEIKDRLIPLLESISATRGGTIDVQDVFRRFAFDTICKISFGLDPGCLELDMPMSEFANAFDTASRLSARRAITTAPIVWKLKRFLNVGSEKELKRAIRLVDDLAKAVIRERRKIGFSKSHDLLSRFMRADHGEQVDDKYLRDIVVSFLLAGRDTVASGLTTFFLLLSQNPSAAIAIRAEIDAHTKDDVLCPDQIQNMHYVHAALYESLRLYPPVQFDSKFSAEDDVLPDGTFVRKGTRVMYHPYAMGRMESIWGDDCMEFRPERWLRDGVFTPENLFKYPVFQAGPRVCLGKELSVMEMKTVIVSIMHKFNVEVLMRGETPQFSVGLTASINGGALARVLHRDRDQL